MHVKPEKKIRIHLTPKIEEFGMNPDKFSDYGNIIRLFNVGFFFLHRTDLEKAQRAVADVRAR